MKRTLSLICSFAVALQALLSAVTVSAADDGIGATYTAPESPAITYNMNLDWKYKEAPNGVTTSTMTTPTGKA